MAHKILTSFSLKSNKSSGKPFIRYMYQLIESKWIYELFFGIVKCLWTLNYTYDCMANHDKPLPRVYFKFFFGKLLLSCNIHLMIRLFLIHNPIKCAKLWILNILSRECAPIMSMNIILCSFLEVSVTMCNINNNRSQALSWQLV